MKLLTKKEWLKQFDGVIKDAEKQGIKFTNKNQKKLEQSYYSYCSHKEGINGVLWGVYHDRVQSLISEYKLLDAVRNFPKDRY